MPDVYDPIQSQMSQKSAQERLADYVTDLLARTNLQLWLTQSNVSPSATNTLANFTIATFGGYAPFNVTSFLAQAVDPGNNAYTTSQINAFACNGVGAGNSIYGNLLVGTPVGALAATATNTGNLTGYSPVFTIVDAGLGYTAPPVVSLTGASGTGAAAHSVLNANGSINEIILDTAGTGYTTYVVVIAPPMELIKHNVLSTSGIAMALSTDVLTTYTQLIEPSNAS